MSSVQQHIDLVMFLLGMISTIKINITSKNPAVQRFYEPQVHQICALLCYRPIKNRTRKTFKEINQEKCVPFETTGLYLRLWYIGHTCHPVQRNLRRSTIHVSSDFIRLELGLGKIELPRILFPRAIVSTSHFFSIFSLISSDRAF